MASAEELDVRVILVGRTGMDAALRLDPGIELVRVRTPLEAVGELATPVDEQSPSSAVVIVAPEVERSLNGDGSHERLHEFVRGLKAANPAVRVFGIAGAGTGKSDAFDATLTTSLSAETLRRGVREVGVPRAAAPASKLEQASQPVVPQGMAPQPGPRAPVSKPVPAPARAPMTQGEAGDLPLVSLLVKGQDLLSAAVSLIRERCSDESVEFVPCNPNAPATLQNADQAVAWEGVVFGYLRAASTGAAVLERHARWLATWLRARDQQAQLRAAAFTDPLTGAYNRRYFDRFLANALEQARGARHSVTVMVFDIDDFKIYNDRYGHDAGDEILRETVRLLRSVIRPTDRVCRIGGDEFAVIFYEPSGPRQEGSRHPASVFGIAQRFQAQVQQHRFPKLAGSAPGTLTISGGLATFPWDGDTPEKLLGRADQLALASKRQGKNAITLGPMLEGPGT